MGGVSYFNVYLSPCNKCDPKLILSLDLTHLQTNCRVHSDCHGSKIWCVCRNVPEKCLLFTKALVVFL